MYENDEKQIKQLEDLITKDASSKLNDIDKITDKIYLGDDEGALKIKNF